MRLLVHCFQSGLASHQVPHSVQTGCGVDPASSYLAGVKLTVHEADRTPPPITDIKISKAVAAPPQSWSCFCSWRIKLKQNCTQLRTELLYGRQAVSHSWSVKRGCTEWRRGALQFKGPQNYSLVTEAVPLQWKTWFWRCKQKMGHNELFASRKFWDQTKYRQERVVRTYRFISKRRKNIPHGNTDVHWRKKLMFNGRLYENKTRFPWFKLWWIGWMFWNVMIFGFLRGGEIIVKLGL